MEILLEQLPSNFYIKDRGNSIYEILMKGSHKSLFVKFPFQIDIEIARLYGMLYDGSLSKNLSNISFSQKKDPNKVYDFANIINSKFGIDSIISKRDDGTLIVTASSTTLGYFLYCCLDFYKSDQYAKIPYWIYNVSDDIIREYLRYAFAMEGSISQPKKNQKEIRFHSTSLLLVKQLQNLFKNKYDINFSVCKYFIKDYGLKYYLSCCSRDDFIKFSKIGFALESHQQRLLKHIEKSKFNSIEATLMALYLENGQMNLCSINRKYFPYIKKAAISLRIKKLRIFGLIENNSYILTKKGLRIVQDLSNLSFGQLRINSIEAEDRILFFLSNRCSFNAEISRELNIDSSTVRGIIKRLINKNLIYFSYKDKFQRKYYKRA